jgi:hypothetical protein
MKKRILSPESAARQRVHALNWYYNNRAHVVERLRRKRLEKRPDLLRRKIAEMQNELEELTT